MLKQRILTAVVLVPLLIAALFFLPIPWLAALFGIFVAAAAWEWSNLSGLRGPRRLFYVVGLLAFGFLCLWALSLRPDLVVTVFGAALLWWLWALVELISRPSPTQGMFTTPAGRFVGGLLVLVPLWVAAVALLVIDAEHPRILLYVFVLVWVADSAAYFTGSQLGKTRLAPQISPGKTVEGVAGGVFGVVLLAWLCGTIIWKFETVSLLAWIGVSVVTALFSVVGDLTESKLKRVAGVKDSGRLLPGHGGMLDRIDALTAAVPIFALGVMHMWKI